MTTRRSGFSSRVRVRHTSLPPSAVVLSKNGAWATCSSTTKSPRHCPATCRMEQGQVTQFFALQVPVAKKRSRTSSPRAPLRGPSPKTSSLQRWRGASHLTADGTMKVCIGLKRHVRKHKALSAADMASSLPSSSSLGLPDIW